MRVPFSSKHFFADDIVLLARNIKDLQRLLNAWGCFFDTKHEQVAVNNTETLFSMNPSNNEMFTWTTGDFSNAAVIVQLQKYSQWSSCRRMKWFDGILLSKEGPKLRWH